MSHPAMTRAHLEAPVVPARRIIGLGGARLGMIIECPFCSRLHIHSGEGHFVAHCIEPAPSCPGYVLIERGVIEQREALRAYDRGKRAAERPPRSPGRAPLTARPDVTSCRRAVAPGVRARILERDDFRCRRCGAGPRDERLVIDHVLPVVLGGGSDLSNLQTLCEPCNQGKAGRAPHPHDLTVDS